MKEVLSIGVIMDPISSISFNKDTTLALLLSAKSRGHTLHYMEMSDLYLENGSPFSQSCPLDVFDDTNTWYSLAPEQKTALATFDIILMRKDPPFDNQYIYATYILERAEALGVSVINNPKSLRDCNEKIFATEFPQCCPPNLVSRSHALLKNFHTEHKDVIFKPLDGMGGSGIFRCKPGDANVSVILETLTEHENGFIMAQKFIPDITKGDKRVLVVNGKAIPYALARIPAQGETRGNLASGGRGVAQPLCERDEWIVAQVAPALIERGLYFVGLDIIGDYLTEINVTSPTCAREIDAAYATDIGGTLMNALEQLRHNT